VAQRLRETLLVPRSSPILQDEPDQVTAAADYVSEYAQDAPREDFAETFMVYVRSKGDVSRLGRTPRLLQKVRFVRQVAAQVAARG